jgi:hypothetical protein
MGAESMSTTRAATIRQFFIEAGIAVPAVAAEQMREVDCIAVQETGPNLYQMMENAGRDVALLAIELLGRSWATATLECTSAQWRDSPRGEECFQNRCGTNPTKHNSACTLDDRPGQQCP